MTGYSSTPLQKKLGYKPDMRCHWRHAPAGYREMLGELPAGVKRIGRLQGTFDLVHAFHTRRAELAHEIARLATVLEPDGMLWISWPKQAAAKAQGIATDLDGNVVRHLGLQAGLVDIKVCAVDDTWSGLKFVIPRKHRRN